PATSVDAEKTHFFELAASIRMGGGADKPAAPPTPTPTPTPEATSPAPEAPSPHPAVPAPEAPASPLKWTAPAGWTKQGDRPMRIVTYVPEKAKNSLVYVAVLSGEAGGVKSNIDRWRTQMGQAELSDAEFAALPRGKVLGAEAVFAEITGTFSGMGGDGE